jgi:hypothetical protein
MMFGGGSGRPLTMLIPSAAVYHYHPDISHIARETHLTRVSLLYELR